MSHYLKAVRLQDAADRLGCSTRQVLRLIARGVLRRIGPGRRGGTWIDGGDLAAYSRRKPSRRAVARWQLAVRAAALETLLLVRAARGGKHDSEGLELAEFVQTEFRARRKAFGRFASLIYESPAAQYARESVADAWRREIGKAVQRAEVALTARQLEYLLAVAAVSFGPASKVRDRRDDPEAFLADAVEVAVRPGHLTALGREMGAEQAARDVVRYGLHRLSSIGLDDVLDGEPIVEIVPLTVTGLRAARRAIETAKASAGWRRFTERMADETMGADRPKVAAVARTLGRSIRAVQNMAQRVSERLGGSLDGLDLARIAAVQRPAVKMRRRRRPAARQRVVPDARERCPVCRTALAADSDHCPECGAFVYSSVY